MRRGILLVACAAVLCVLLVACGGDNDDNGSSAGAASGDGGGAGSGSALQVNIVDFGYEPDSLMTPAGEAVALEITNGGDLPHTFTIDGVVDSTEIAPGESASVSFTPADAGTLTFFCTIHGAVRMSGELTVN